jgi:hypothetical protein
MFYIVDFTLIHLFKGHAGIKLFTATAISCLIALLMIKLSTHSMIYCYCFYTYASIMVFYNINIALIPQLNLGGKIT